MHVGQLLRDFLLAEHVEVIRAGIPEGRRIGVLRQTRAASGQALTRYALLQNLHGHGNASFVRLSDEQVDMLRHDHIANHLEFIFLTYFFKDLQEQVSPRSGAEEWLPLVTATGDEMEVATSIEPAQSFEHGEEF